MRAQRVSGLRVRQGVCEHVQDPQRLVLSPQGASGEAVRGHRQPVAGGEELEFAAQAPCVAASALAGCVQKGDGAAQVTVGPRCPGTCGRSYLGGEQIRSFEEDRDLSPHPGAGISRARDEIPGSGDVSRHVSAESSNSVPAGEGTSDGAQRAPGADAESERQPPTDLHYQQRRIVDEMLRSG